jgi:hypothetical protein
MTSFFLFFFLGVLLASLVARKVETPLPEPFWNAMLFSSALGMFLVAVL